MAQSQPTALVTVASESGRAVTDLTAADFIVREKNTQHEVARADRINAVPLYLSILLDISQPPLGTPPPISDMRSALSAFVETIRAANPGAQIAYAEVAGAAVPAVAFDAPAADLDRAISRIVVGQQADAVMIEGLADAARALQRESSIRKSILLIDFGSNDPTRTATANIALQEIQKAQATVWSVSIRPANAPSSRREAALQAAVESTGGVRLTAVSATGLKTLLQQMANTISSQYLVTFNRQSSSPISPDDIRVETKKGHKALVAILLR